MKAELIVIENAVDHAAAMASIARLMGSRRRNDRARLRAQARLVEAWEAERYPLRAVDPIDAIAFRMEQSGLTRADLIGVIGNKSKVSEVLGRKRPLSLAMIRNLRAKLGIPADLLIAA